MAGQRNRGYIPGPRMLVFVAEVTFRRTNATPVAFRAPSDTFSAASYIRLRERNRSCGPPVNADDFRHSPRGPPGPGGRGGACVRPEHAAPPGPAGPPASSICWTRRRRPSRGSTASARRSPTPDLLIAPFLRREAVLSSRIEGTQASVADVYDAEATGAPRGDAREVVNYVRALRRGAERLGDPADLRAARPRNARGAARRRAPGRTRAPARSARSRPGSAIGTAPSTMRASSRHRRTCSAGCSATGRRFVHDEAPLPPPGPLRAHALPVRGDPPVPRRQRAHRTGADPAAAHGAPRAQASRCSTSAPGFERRRQRYYDGLYAVSATGDWTPWLRFFPRRRPRAGRRRGVARPRPARPAG